MEKDTNTAVPSAATARIRHRKRSNEVGYSNIYVFYLVSFSCLWSGVPDVVAFVKEHKIQTCYQVVPEPSKANGGNLLVDDHNKYKSMWIRTYSTVWMIGGFVLTVYMGHLYITAMVVVIQLFMAKELFNLLRKAHEDRHLPGFRLLNW